MNRTERCFVAAWPHFMVIACVLMFAGCQDGSGPGLVTSPEGKPSYEGAKPPPPPPPNQVITYIAEAGRGQDKGDAIWKMNADGSNKVVVLPPRYMTHFLAPTWSPDVSAIAFASYAAGGRGLERVQADGTGLITLMTNEQCHACGDPAWSPTGTEIAVLGGGENGTVTGYLWIVPAGGGTPELLFLSPEGSLYDVAWNSDGTRLAFSQYVAGTRSLKVIERSTGVVTTVLENFGHVHGVDWAGQGVDRLVFDTDTSIYTLDISVPGQTPQLVNLGGLALGRPSFSPDNSAIVFGGVYTVSLAGGLPVQLAVGREPDWKR